MSETNITNILTDEELEQLKAVKTTNPTNGESVKVGMTKLMKLLLSSSIEEEERIELQAKILSGNYDDKLYYYLLMEQLDPIEQGQSYNQGDIQKKLNEVMADGSK